MGQGISSFMNVREENKKLKALVEKYELLELNVEFRLMKIKIYKKF